MCGTSCELVQLESMFSTIHIPNVVTNQQLLRQDIARVIFTVHVFTMYACLATFIVKVHAEFTTSRKQPFIRRPDPLAESRDLRIRRASTRYHYVNQLRKPTPLNKLTNKLPHPTQLTAQLVVAHESECSQCLHECQHQGGMKVDQDEIKVGQGSIKISITKYHQNLGQAVRPKPWPSASWCRNLDDLSQPW